ncbi:hypothetical protein M407DRAFT_21009 [Tulasnella calospora MUT 4182]|uniref:NADP-dependent oxidoreductase domain-containing protein n=1 Tax=Tulasnella calospora MUT 4182 TaxID=1051891 RepID=A0A0C3QF58_9AGAM|nr:hypothetical protein M407DRAFT_21009 [Tulasnella calospora MUT 4182]
MSAENNMQYVRLGKSGLKVSRIILGCASYGSKSEQSWILEEEEAVEHIKLAYDLGINTFDTGDTYSNGESERILGKAIKKYSLPRDEIVVMTKAWGAVSREPGPIWASPEEKLDQLRYTNQYGLTRKHLFAAIKDSLERLQLDYVDVLQCHRFDYNTPVEETMHALHEIVKAGYARYIGMSSCYAWQFHKMQNYARQHELTEFISMQNLYNPIYREEEREMIPLLKDLGVGMIPWSPNAGGVLARPLTAQTKRSEGDTYAKFGPVIPFLPAVNNRIEEIAKNRGISMAQVVLAWSLGKGFVTAPIVGTTSLDKLRDSAGAIHVKLTEEEIKSIDEPYQARAVYGFA